MMDNAKQLAKKENDNGGRGYILALFPSFGLNLHIFCYNDLILFPLGAMIKTAFQNGFKIVG